MNTNPTGVKIGVAMLSAAVVLLLVSLLLPLTRSARDAARIAQCRNILKIIALALCNYESANGTFPPAYTVDSEGNRLHSWRSLILPYLAESDVYELIDFSKPWDDPVNTKAREAVAYTYDCPNAEHPEGLTTYLGVVGPHRALSGSAALRLTQIHEDYRQSIVVIEADPSHAVHWMSPQDISEDLVLGYGPESRMNHAGFILAAFLDGHAEQIPLETFQDRLRAVPAIDGHDSASGESSGIPGQ